MQLVYIHKPGTKATTIRELSTAEAAGIKLHFVKGVEESVARDLLQEAWTNRHWLACDCRGSESTAPLMYVKRGDGHRFTLVRMFDRGTTHASTCEFADQRTGAVDLKELDSHAGVDILSSVFSRWYEAADLNVAYPCGAGDIVPKQYEALHEIAKSQFLEPKRKLSEFCATHPNGLLNLVTRLKRDAERSSTRTSWGVYLQFVDSLEDAIPLGSISIERNALQRSGRTNLMEVGGPNAVLSRVVASADPSRHCHIDAMYLQPVYSRKRMIPICFASERRTLKQLIDIQMNLARAHQTMIRIRKTLPGHAAYERGIAFQIQRLGPNGRAVLDIDIVSIEQASPARELSNQPSGDVIYHASSPDCVESEPDRAFRSRTIERLLVGMDRPVGVNEHKIRNVSNGSEAVLEA